MALVYTEIRRNLSAAPTGLGVKITSTSSPVIIHVHNDTTDPSYQGVKSVFDEVHLWAMNSHSSSVAVKLHWGGSVDPDNLLPTTLASSSFLKVVNGLPISGDLTVSAVATVANKVMLYGYVLSHTRELAVDPTESS